MTDTEIINPDISGPVNIDGEEWCGADHECHTWKQVYNEIVAYIK